MLAVQLGRKERIASLLGQWSEKERREFGRLLGRFNEAVTEMQQTDGNRQMPLSRQSR
jgi:hypothetical protein